MHGRPPTQFERLKMPRHYIAIATGFARLFADLVGHDDRVIRNACKYELESACQMIADTFERSDPRFNRHQFYELSGYEG